MLEAENKPVAVLMSDVHYDLNTLEVADAAVNQAIDLANTYGIPLIIAGDLHNTKAHLRSECVRRMTKTFQRCKIPAIIDVGNHDKDNEKSESHALEFLRPYCTIIDKPVKNHIPHWTIIPYFHDKEALKKYLKTLKPKSRIIMHQGILGSDAGEYIQDHSALAPEDLAGFTVISGHYHRAQRLTLPGDGVFTYIGNPYTLNFGEADHPEKRILLLCEDGRYEEFETNLRKHVVLSFDATEYGLVDGQDSDTVRPTDILKVIVHGSQEELNKITKDKLRWKNWPEYFKLELIPTEIKVQTIDIETKSPNDLFENMIDKSTGITDDQKKRLQSLWKDLV